MAGDLRSPLHKNVLCGVALIYRIIFLKSCFEYLTDDICSYSCCEYRYEKYQKYFCCFAHVIFLL